MDALVLGAAIAGSAGLAGAGLWAAIRYTRPPQAVDEKPVKLEIIPDDPHPATLVRAPASVAPRAPAPRAGPAPPPASSRSHAERAPAMVLTQGVRMQDAEFERRGRPSPPPSPSPPPMRAPPVMKSWAKQVMETAQPEVPTEWARRQVGPVEPGRVAGVCGGCGARLSVSNARPLKIACPVCGRTKLVA